MYIHVIITKYSSSFMLLVILIFFFTILVENLRLLRLKKGVVVIFVIAVRELICDILI